MNPSFVGTIGTRAMLGAFRALGLDARRIQAEAGFEDEELVDPDRLLPVDRFYRIWELADRAWGRPGLGLHAGRVVPFGALEVLDYLLLTSPTVEEGMTQVARSFPLTTRTVRYEISLEGDHAVCAMVWRMSPRGIMFHLRDFSLAVFTGRIFHASGRRPERVELHGPPLAGEDEYARVFGAPTALRAARNAMVFAMDAWRQPHARRDDDLNRTLRRHADLLIERQTDGGAERVADRVRTELLRTAQVGLIPVEQVAARLAMSARTLQRRLRAEGTTFDEVGTDVRASLAREYLGDRGLNISEVAYLVGFSESSAFSRAFRRWTGQTPQAFRAGLAGLTGTAQG